MIQMHGVLLLVVILSSITLGAVISAVSARDYRNMLDKDYKKKYDQMRDTIIKETKNQWSQGWDAAYSRVGKTTKAYYLWFREHGYSEEDIEEWLEEYLNKN